MVIPTRNRRTLLRRTISTVLAQVGVDLEIIVVDEGSTDDTAGMLEGLADPRIRRVHHEAPRGVSLARNAGIQRARGEWIAFLDDDDLWAPEKLAAQRAAAATHGRLWAYSGSVAVDAETLRVISGSPPPHPDRVVERLPWRNTVVGGASSVMVRRELLRRTGAFDPRLRHMADWDLWIRLAQAGGAPAVVPRPLLAYVQHAGNASIDTTGMLTELSIMENRYRELRGGRRVDRAYVHRWMAWNSLRAGRRVAAMGHYLRATASGDLASIARLSIAALHPSAPVWISRFQRQPEHWKAAAEEWLTRIPR